MRHQPGNSDQPSAGGHPPQDDHERTLDASDGAFSTLSVDGEPAPGAEAMPAIKGYRLTGKIGEAGQGSVWRAVQLSTGREVALKFLRAGTFSSDNARARFEREVKLTARLNHRNITAIYDSGVHHGAYYYAMEFIDGVHLDEYVRKNALDHRGILEIMRLVCQAIQHAHQHGVIHRDLKPSNILLTADGQPHVLDFGLAKTVREGDGLQVSLEGDAPGTLPFMSPEQAAGRVDELDTRTDVYSLGVILYNLLTGRFPHELTGTVLDIRRRISEEMELRPRAACSAIDRDLEALLLKALTHEADGRYESAAEFARDIDNYLSGEPLLARPHTVFYFLGKRLRKYRLHVGIAAAVTATLIAGAVFSYVKIAIARNEAVAMAEARRRESYFKSMQLAQSEFLHTEIARVKDVLAACPVDLRGWEWHRMRRIHDQSTRTLENPGGKIFWVDVSPDGSRVLLAGDGGLARVYDSATGRSLHDLRGHEGIVYSAVFAPGGDIIATGGGDGVVCLWNATTGDRIAAFRALEKNVTCMAINQAGNRLAIGGDKGMVKVFEFPSGRELLSLMEDTKDPPRDVNAVAFSADGRFIATGGDGGKLVIWDAKGGMKIGVLAGHEDAIYSLAFSADGNLLASGSADRTVRLWDARYFQEMATLMGHCNYVTSVRFTPDSRRLISASWDRTIKAWDVPAGNDMATLRGHTGPISALAVWPDGGKIASGGQDRTVKFWDLVGNGPDKVLTGHGDFVHAAVFVAQGRRIISADRSTGLRLWDADTGCLIRNSDTYASPTSSVASAPAAAGGGAFALAALPDGQRFVAAGTDGQVRLCDVRTTETLRVLGKHHGIALSVAVSRDGSLIASGGTDGIIQIWDAELHRIRTIQGIGGDVRALAFCPDGKHLAVGGVDGLIRVFTVSDGLQTQQLEGHAGSVECLAFSPDGSRLVSGGADKTIRMWDASTGRPIKTLFGHAGPVYSLAFNPDGSRLISGAEDRTIRVWDTWSGVEAMTLYGHDGAVWSVSFSPDGKKILSSSADTTVRVWGSGSWNESINMSNSPTAAVRP